MVDRIEAVAAQVFTAKQALLEDTEADLRVALVLFDTAMETLMVRRIEDALLMWRFDGDPQHWQRVIAVDLDDLGQRERARVDGSDFDVAWRMSSSQRRSIDREFASKVRFLTWWGDVPTSFARSIVRLHDYRNELVHRDSVRSRSLRLSVFLAAWFVCEFLRRLTPAISGWGQNAREEVNRIRYRAGLGPFVGDELDMLTETTSERLQNLIADSLIVGLDSELVNAPTLLAEVVRDRLGEIDRWTRLIGGWVFDDRPHTELDALRWAFSSRDSGDLDELRKTRIPVTRSKLELWRSWPARLDNATSALEAFDSLASFEIEFEPFEKTVADAAYEADGQIQEMYEFWKDHGSYP